MAHWICGWNGTAWLDDLVKAGRAMLIYNNTGYPLRYAVPISDLLAQLPDLPTPHMGPPVIGEDYYMPTGWRGSIEIHHDKLQECGPNEVVIVEAWDQS